MTKLNKTPLTIRAKRGTEAQITATSPAPYQLEGEIAYATDTKQYYVSDGTRFLRVVTADVNGNVGIGTDSPTAVLHLKAGSTTVAPLKLTSGTLLTTPETGAIEYAGSKTYITNKSLRKAIDRTSDVKLTTTTVENTTTETTVFTANVPANSWVAGNVLDMTMFGDISNDVGGDDVTINVKVDGTTIATVVTDGRKLTNTCWELIGHAIIRTVGESGTMAWTMALRIDGQDTDFTCDVSGNNTTGALDITATAQWDAEDADNVFKCIGGYMSYKN